LFLKKNIVFWVEAYLYNPNSVQKILSSVLLPLSWLYCLIVYLRYKSKKAEDMGVAVVSVGNLTVGGSGKTPLVTALASRYENVAIVLRGYGRQSRGLVVVKDAKEILCDVYVSGDEAMIYAHKIPHALVIVSEDRKEGIQKAKELGAKLVFLDDGYSKHDIAKLDLLIDIDLANQNCLPSGAFREKIWRGKEVILLKEQKDFVRVVELKNKSDKMSLVTAIARGGRLDPYLPRLVSKNYFEDHHIFLKEELKEILERDGSESLLVTYKDYVKVESFGLPLSLLDLDVDVDESVFTKIDFYTKGYDAKKN
jgi:tetraacyldisaccharide 4'-kinase